MAEAAGGLQLLHACCNYLSTISERIIDRSRSSSLSVAPPPVPPPTSSGLPLPLLPERPPPLPARPAAAAPGRRPSAAPALLDFVSPPPCVTTVAAAPPPPPPTPLRGISVVVRVMWAAGANSRPPPLVLAVDDSSARTRADAAPCHVLRSSFHLATLSTLGPRPEPTT